MRITTRLRTTTRLIALCLALVGGLARPAISDAQAPTPEEQRTPPRLSFVDGQVSFRRPGVEEWTPARVNTPLAPGDELSADSPGTLELQIGGQAYVRAWTHTRLGLENLGAGSIRLRVAAGHVAVDLRRPDDVHTVELAAPNGSFTIETAGYYRIEVAAGSTRFIARRGGRATLTPVGATPAASEESEPVAIAENDEIVLAEASSPAIARHAAPAPDAWDQWNTARTDALLTAASSQYVSTHVYGAADLDRYGAWRVDESYGPVWSPGGLSEDWAPYSDGRWLWDPYYGWTWVENAPWGWAPFHYGRWVFVSGSWVWAPGPRVARPVYAPALVAFFGGRPGVAVGVAGPTVGWVALGWGEPLIPWWGRVGFVGVPWWAGWGGPRVVNNVIVSHTTVVHVSSVRFFRNTSVKNAVVAVPRDHFGRTSVKRTRGRHVDLRALDPMRGTVVPDPTHVSRGMTRDPDGPRSRARSRPAPVAPPAAGQRPTPSGPAQKAKPTPPVRVPAPAPSPTPALTAPAPATRPIPARTAPAPATQPSAPAIRPTPARAVPAPIAGPAPSTPAASRPAPRPPRAEHPAVSAPAVPTRGASAPAPQWRRDDASRDQRASRAAAGRVDPPGARLNKPHPAPATRVQPPMTGRQQEGRPPSARQGARSEPRHGGTPRR
jgi:hypothetical protein